MKKIFTASILGLSLAAAMPAAAEDLIDPSVIQGSYVCQSIEGKSYTGSISNYDNEGWTGHEMTVDVNKVDGVKEIRFTNMIPMQGYYTYDFYGIPYTATTAYVASGRSTVNSLKACVSTTKAGAQDLDTGFWYDPDGIADLIVEWSDDLKTITMEKFAIKTISNGDLLLYADKIVYKKVERPNAPTVRASFKPATKSLDVDVTAPTSLTYQSGGGEITGSLTKVELYRQAGSADYALVKTWENVAPGAVSTYSDTDIDLDGSVSYHYKAYAYIDDTQSDASWEEAGNISVVAPSVKDLKAVSGASNDVTLSFTLPAADELFDLTLDEVAIYKRGENEYQYPETPVKTFTSGLTAGKAMSFTDNDVSEGNEYYYQVNTTWKYGKGYGPEVKIYIGEDTPGRVEKFEAAVDVNDVALSWTAAVGKHDGTVDYSKVRYSIDRRLAKDVMQSGKYPSQKTITPEGGIAELSFTDKLSITEPKEYLYILNSFYTGGEPCEAGSAMVTAGPNYTIGFTETFDSLDAYENRTMDKIWTASSTFGYTPSVVTDSQYTSAEGVSTDVTKDKHKGFLKFENYSNQTYRGQSYDFTSLPFDFSDAQNPAVLYELFVSDVNSPAYVNLQAVDAAADSAQPVTYTTDKIGDSSLEGKAPVWRACGAVLSDFAGKDNVKVNFHVVCGDNDDTYMQHVHIDNIKVVDVPAPTNVALAKNQEDFTYTVSWTDPSNNDLLVDEFEVYRTKTQATYNAETAQSQVFYDEADLDKNFELVATVKTEPWEYKDSMLSNHVLDVTKHKYYVMAVYKKDLPNVRTKSETVQVDEVLAGIGMISSDLEGSVRYYNLQGLPVSAPAKGETLIRVSNGKAQKITL